MHRSRTTILMLLYICLVALGMYELTAKSPEYLGVRLPGWQAGRRAEKATPWTPQTGILPVDHLMHESCEAARFYGYLVE